MRESLYERGESIFLQGECITSFRAVSNNVVECVIEERNYDTAYYVKPIRTYTTNQNKKQYFLQVRRVRFKD